MSYQVLARKWRPKFFSQVVGQSHVVRILKNALIKNQLGHAYLLTGTRGVGKTTIARLFAMALRCREISPEGEVCGECVSCEESLSDSSMNIIEIDGASYNKVEDVRELLQGTGYLPTSGKYKIYIVDEVHMLSTSAFNALLKTLEEPPKHVIFIFATTNPQKIPATILSRCQRFDLHPIDLKSLTSYIFFLFKKENIVCDDPYLVEQICSRGKGSLRDTLSLLDQVLTYSGEPRIKEEFVVNALQIAPKSLIKELFYSLWNEDSVKVKKVYRSLLYSNISVKEIGLALLEECFFVIEETKTSSKPELFWIYENMAKEIHWCSDSVCPEKIFEVVLQKIACRRDFFKVEEKKEEQSKKKVKKKSWTNFINSLSLSNSMLASYLSQGTFSLPLFYTNDILKISLQFSESSKIFHDYLIENKSHLTSLLKDYFEVPLDSIDLKLSVFVEKDKEDHKNSLKKRVSSQKRKESLLKIDPLLEKAQSIFNVQVDDINTEKKDLDV